MAEMVKRSGPADGAERPVPAGEREEIRTGCRKAPSCAEGYSASNVMEMLAETISFAD